MCVIVCLLSGVFKSYLLSSMSSGLLVIVMFLCVCIALSYLDVVIKDYYFEDYYLLVCVFLVSPCCVHRDRRPDQTVSGVPSPRSVLFVFSSGNFVPVICPSRLSDPAVRGSSRRRSRLTDPAVSWSSRRRSRINQPAVRRR